MEQTNNIHVLALGFIRRPNTSHPLHFHFCRHSVSIFSMDSGSSSTNMALPRVNGSNYDVFLSFRGVDTRDSFTDHLYERLVQAGIHTFRDNDEIAIGEELKPEIEKAIEASLGSIVILSENYATSTWCLDELWLILKQRRECNHFVLPIYLHVDPSDVRKNNKSFNIKVKSSTRWTDDNVNRWKGALTEVADLKGPVLSGPETDFQTDIVDTICRKLDRNQVYLPPTLTGIDARVQKITRQLQLSDAKFLIIYGMGGSGKSTLAQCFVNQNMQYFQSTSIIQCIGSRCKEADGLLRLQEQLFKDILGCKKRRIPTVCQGPCKIEKVLQMKKALIVLDDIVDPSQLEYLLGAGNINKQSKIIITTMKNDLDNWFTSRSIRFEKYKMELLDEVESLELLCLHAFGSKISKECYKEVAERVVQYCDGNPLALKVLGSSLSEYDSVKCWESEMKLFGKDLHHDINLPLTRSYDLLPHKSDRELFLHIACFFVGKDIDYVVTILEPDYSASSRIKTLKRDAFFISRQTKSRVWRNSESRDVLRKGKGSGKMKGLALDMHMLAEEEEFNWSENKRLEMKWTLFSAKSLPNMDQLELLQLNSVRFEPFKEDFAERLRWLSWIGFDELTMPSHLCMEKMVALDMSYSCLKEFEPPMVLQSLKILNLKSSRYLQEIRNISRLPNLETLILWNCHELVDICKTIKDLRKLTLLNMTGCEHLHYSFSFPCPLERIFLKDCNLECTDDFPLSFSDQSALQYLNLGGSKFEELPTYNHLKSLRVLDLSLCSMLRYLLCLPSTLAELYIYYCTSLENVSFESGVFTLQEFGYEGCSNLSEVEGFIKLVPLAKLDEADLGHMKWLKEYESHELCLAGDDELMKNRSSRLQMLYEFNIRSISLPEVNDPNMMHDHVSKSMSLSFKVPICPKNKRLKGLNVYFKYTRSGDDWVWFAKIKTTNSVNLVYNPKVFGEPKFGVVSVWLSYWPIGEKLNVGDSVDVSIVVTKGLKIHECGATLVYADVDDAACETMQNNTEWIHILGGDVSRFQLSTKAYYLCRRDFFELMEVGRLTPGWLSTLVGDDGIDDTEVRGWRKTGRPQQAYQSFVELKTVKCIVYGPESVKLLAIILYLGRT
ncbi:hypothetical protein OSB04_016684 [Centaurea solstitialis]|uniref:TIR domain-containing protein n=1 Tax=Centaurea solstitialis TaxID=347529 RepID=A0AA38T334_9ASTR|nr:hypothetical protein OSB04_016684 [Centaurea solstitialis]